MQPFLEGFPVRCVRPEICDKNYRQGQGRFLACRCQDEQHSCGPVQKSGIAGLLTFEERAERADRKKGGKQRRTLIDVVDRLALDRMQSEHARRRKRKPAVEFLPPVLWFLYQDAGDEQYRRSVGEVQEEVDEVISRRICAAESIVQEE